MHKHASRRHQLKIRKHQPPAEPTKSSSNFKRNGKKKQPRARSERERGNHGMPESASQTVPRSNEPSTVMKPNTAYKKHDPNQHPDIHSFLEASTPPMADLMDAFVDFGCTNKDYLLAISRWSPEGIQNFLNQLSLGPTGRQLTEMEKFILEYHFKEYFTQPGKKENSKH
jgi:hypothetical protein